MIDQTHDDSLPAPVFRPDVTEALAQLDPDYLELYLDFRNSMMAENPLDARTRELVSIGLDASVTHLYLPGIVKHIRNALAVGVTPAEIMAVLKMVALLGVHSLNEAAPVLLQEMARATESGDGPAPRG
jgi:alkylhydroperoxidase/carboxymuconolactone decarboxylase family protein YurZ